MLERWAKLPAPLQDKFLDRLQGAADAIEAMTPPGVPGQAADRPAV